MFTDKIKTIIYNAVATIGEKLLIRRGIGKVKRSWTDDEGNCTQKN